MAPYIFLYLFASFAAFFDGRKSLKKMQFLFAGLLGAYIFLLIGSRFEIGADWSNYLEILYSTEDSNLLEAISIRDPGYMLVNYVSNKSGLGILGVNLVCASIFTIGLLRFAFSLPRPLLAIVISIPYLVIVVGMGYSRQGAALGFIFFSIPYMRTDETRKFLAYIALAAMFHKPAILLALFPALVVSKSKIVSFTTTILLAGLSYALILHETVDDYLYIYIEREYSSAGALIRIALTAIPAAIFLLFRHRWRFDSTEQKFWTTVSCSAVLLACAIPFVPSTTALDRMAIYLSPVQILVFCSLPTVFCRGRQIRTLCFLAIVLFWGAILLGWLTLTNYSSNWLPYKSYIFL